MTKFDITPESKPTVMELVSSLGVDVSDWKNFKKGENYAASNPKYCYEWSFDAPNHIVILNLWLDSIREKHGQITWRSNMRAWASEPHLTGPERRRSLEMDRRIHAAFQNKSIVRAIICIRKKKSDRTVFKRRLDPEGWRAIAYNHQTGECTIKRGVSTKNVSKIKAESAVDDLQQIPKGNRFPDRAKVVARVIKRNEHVRKYVLNRAKGKCEFCGVRGFPTPHGGFYVETHHIIALCDSGEDTIQNVIALCPQHHRQAHYGIDADSLEAKFIAKLKQLNRH